ncbi:hypothetical protein ACFIOY_21360 [Bradyrhizobium sp. TZ2]
MTKRSRKSEIFEQYGDKHHRPSRVILFDDDPRNDVWLDALDAFDRGDKSELVALLKSGYSLPPAIVAHIGDAIDRYDFKRPAHAPRKASYVLADADIALNSANVAVDDLMSKGRSLVDAIAAVANKRDIPVSKLTEYHAGRRRSQRKR